MEISGTGDGEDGPGSGNFGPARKSSRDPVEGPGCAVETTPMSSMSLPGRSGEGLQDKREDFLEDGECLLG